MANRDKFRADPSLLTSIENVALRLEEQVQELQKFLRQLRVESEPEPFTIPGEEPDDNRA